ncbi:MAG TPA: carbohydrate kinase family protein [Candidatus Saccharimonadales bacterium]|nr:carbohydrate kinase family protein [Candidatus Saccharimonadales bacterium]
MIPRLRMLCIGTATQDVFLRGDIFKGKRENGEMFAHIPLGEKLDVDEVVFTTGGNAANASVTFARQGLDSNFMGVIGTDPAGEAVLRDLDAESVGTSHLKQKDDFKTGYSTVLLAPNGERTILRNHGNVINADGSDIDLDAIAKADWLYLSSLGSMSLLEKVISLAGKNGVQVAINPGTMELRQASKLRDMLADVAVLITNKEEMQELVEGKTAEELLRHAAQLVPTVLISDGPRGSIATDGKKIVKAGMYKDVKVVDRLGAGDAFGSGFVAKFAQGASLADAVVFASANSTSVVTKIGAKAGILHAGTKLSKMPIQEKDF